MRALVFAGFMVTGASGAAREADGQSVSELKKLSVEQLMEVEVTSVSKRPERLAATPSAIQVITQEDIRRSGASSLPEALRLAPNLSVARVDSRQWAISARGFKSTSANKLLVLMDGRTLYTPLFSGIFWDAQDTLLEDIDRIEVISGPGATLWGANAVNGVINIITKSARETPGLLLNAGAGTELRAFGGLRYGGMVTSNLHYRVYGKYFARDRSRLSNGAEATDDWHMGQGGVRLDWDASAASRVTFQGDLYDGQIAQPGAAQIGLSGGNVLGRLSHALSEFSDLKLQAYYDRTQRRIPGTFAEDLGTYELDFQHRLPAGDRHDVLWGVSYRLIDDDVNNGAGLAFLPAQVRRQWFTGFVQDEIALVENRLTLTLGSKFEHNDYTGFEIQPGARLAWQASERQMVWAAVSRAVRTPSRIDTEFYVPGAPPFLLAGGPGFRSEQLLAYELGYRVQPHQRLALSVAAFFNEYEGLRSLEQTAPPAPFPLVIGNGLDGESYGVEVTADFQATERWRLRAGFTELQIRIRPKPGSTDTTFGGSESRDSNHQLHLRSLLDLPHQVEFDSGFRYVSAIPSQRVPAYVELDLRLGWRPRPNLELSLVGQNLVHDQHAEFGALPGRAEIERGVFGKVSWRF